MNILYLHNYYQQPGGEDLAFTNEANLMEANGHAVHRFTLHNDSVSGMGATTLARLTHWNSAVARDVRDLVRRHKISVCHFHNTFPLMSPAAYYAAKQAGAAVVQTLHNYRLLCPAATLYRNGLPCERCIGKTYPWPSIVHGCYRRDRAATGIVASMLLMHRVLHTWHRQVDIHIALTPFSRDKLQEGGLSGHKIVVKNNFLDQDPGVGPGGGQFALFIGRLTEEKGVRTLLSAWEKIGARFPLKIIGGGPLANVVKEAAHHNPGVLQLGRVSDVELDRELGRATALMFPSEWYEGQPRTIIESYAKGTPVVASRLGSMATLVDHGRTGLHFRAGDPDDLAAKVEGLISNPAEAAGLRKGARSEFEARYTAAANYRDLLNIYERAQRLAVRGVESQDQVAAFRSSSLLR